MPVDLPPQPLMVARGDYVVRKVDARVGVVSEMVRVVDTQGRPAAAPVLGEGIMTNGISEEKLAQIVTNAVKAGRGSWLGNNALPILIAIAAAFGVWNFNDRLTNLEARLHDDIKWLGDKIDTIAIQQAHDEGHH